MSLRVSKPASIFFVLGAFALGGVMVFSFGGGEMISRHESFLLYFDDTVNGLGPGSEVTFKGVPIGRVESVRLNYRQSPDDKRVPVVVQLNVSRAEQELGVLAHLSEPAVLATQVRRGLRGELRAKSYVLGNMFVDLDFHPLDPVPAMPPSQEGLPVIPTIHSEAVSGLNKIQSVIAWLPTVDFEDKIGRAGEGVDSLTAKVAAIPLGEYSQTAVRKLQPMAHGNVQGWQRNLDNFLLRLNHGQTTLATSNSLFYAQSQDFVKMNGDTRQSLQQINASLAEFRNNLQPVAPWLEHLTHNLHQLSLDMDNLAGKTNALEQQPAVLHKLQN